MAAHIPFDQDPQSRGGVMRIPRVYGWWAVIVMLLAALGYILAVK